MKEILDKNEKIDVIDLINQMKNNKKIKIKKITEQSEKVTHRDLLSTHSAQQDTNVHNQLNQNLHNSIFKVNRNSNLLVPLNETAAET